MLQVIVATIEIPVLAQRQIQVMQSIQKTFRDSSCKTVKKVGRAGSTITGPHEDRGNPTNPVHRQSSERVPSVITQRQMSIIQKIQKTVEILQVQFFDEVVDVPLCYTAVSCDSKVQKTVKIHRSSTLTRSSFLPLSATPSTNHPGSTEDGGGSSDSVC